MKQQLLFGGEVEVYENPLQERLEALSIIDVGREILGDRIRKQEQGRKWKGLCPFHMENHASFFLWPDSNVGMCYGCGVHMTALGLVFSPVWQHPAIETVFPYPNWTDPALSHDPLEYLQRKVGYQDSVDRASLIEFLQNEAERNPLCHEGKGGIWDYLGVDLMPPEEKPSSQEHFDFSWEF